MLAGPSCQRRPRGHAFGRCRRRINRLAGGRIELPDRLERADWPRRTRRGRGRGADRRPTGGTRRSSLHRRHTCPGRRDGHRSQPHERRSNRNDGRTRRSRSARCGQLIRGPNPRRRRRERWRGRMERLACLGLNLRDTPRHGLVLAQRKGEWGFLLLNGDSGRNHYRHGNWSRSRNKYGRFRFLGCFASGRALKMSANLRGFIVFKRARVRPFVGDSNFGQVIEDRSAFDFELACQIVNANLTHLLCFVSPLRSSPVANGPWSVRPNFRVPYTSNWN